MSHLSIPAKRHSHRVPLAASSKIWLSNPFSAVFAITGFAGEAIAVELRGVLADRDQPLGWQPGQSGCCSLSLLVLPLLLVC